MGSALWPHGAHDVLSNKKGKGVSSMGMEEETGKRAV